MKSILREQRRSSIVAAAVTILLGLMLVLVPNRSIRFLCGLLGTALMVTGLIYILGWFAKRRDGFPVWFLIPGLLLAALGLWLLSRPASVIVLIQFSFAAVLLFHGVIDLQSALSLMREGWPVVDRSGSGRPDPGAGGCGAVQSFWHHGGSHDPHRSVPGV